CGMALHWLDPDDVLARFSALSRTGALWLVYNFAFDGHPDCDAFNRWFATHLDRYPAPPRHTVDPIRSAPRVVSVARASGHLAASMTHDTLVGYLTTQSNVEAAVQRGRTYEAIEAEMHDALASVAWAGPFRFRWSYTLWRYTG
ncbi:MAG: hypothetical protein AAF460_15595, partial [Pseudomonadota bacterium]